MNFYREIINSSWNLEYENCWINYHPDFLTGTSVKIARYEEPLLYKRLFELFKINLENADRLIVIGYGFKDSEINKIIENHFNKGNKIYIVDPYATEGSMVFEFIKTHSNCQLISKEMQYITIGDFN